MKKIAIFNHKGGVSKTTTTFNVGWMLAKKNKRVLVVDADSQCNLTMFALGPEKFDKFIESNNINNIKDALEAAFKAKPRLVDAIDCFPVDRNSNLFILPGHLDLSEYEVQLGVSFQLSNALGTMKNLPGSFNYLLEKTAEKYHIDYILIDMNPSLSAINQTLFVNSDYFLVPTSPDLFSFMAIKSLARILPSWEHWAKSARTVFSDADYPMASNTPKFLGYTINRFNLSSGRPTQAFENFMDKISEVVESELIPNLKIEGMLVEENRYMLSHSLNHELRSQRKIDKYCIAEISDFNKLIAMSNKQSIPVFELPTHNLIEGQIQTLFWFKKLFEIIAKKIILLTQDA